MTEPGYDCRWSLHGLAAVSLLTAACSAGPDHVTAPDLSADGAGPIDQARSAVGPGGGSVDHLLFAVVGDTRPSALDATDGYPTPVITKIFADIEAMSPHPQFVIATGDYMYATPTKMEGAAQLAMYQKAMRQFAGPVFAAMGNHECDGYTADNCTNPTNNYTAFMDVLVTPLGQTRPYYAVPITATDGSWTAKLLIVACNAWSSEQQSWLEAQLATTTTYTIVVRHEPASASTGPCVPDAEAALAAHPYDLSLVGHTHHYAAGGKEIIVGNGGAPLSGGTYGYAVVEQTAAGFAVTDYDYATSAPVSSVTVP